MTKSMEEIVEAELEQCRLQNPEISENGLYVSFLNNFPTYLPNTKYKSPPMDVRDGRVSHGKFKRDVRKAIAISGLKKYGLERHGEFRQQLLAYVNFLSHLGIDQGTAQLHRELIYPVYITLRKMGYTHSGLSS